MVYSQKSACWATVTGRRGPAATLFVSLTTVRIAPSHTFAALHVTAHGASILNVIGPQSLMSQAQAP
jgi:hypothetical protein